MQKIVCGEEDSETSEPTKFQCLSNASLCLDIKVRCNGTAECPHGEDEDDCGGCRLNEFECANKNCIRLDWRCDRQDDCLDGSDEVNCGGVPFSVNQRNCSDQEFSCKDGKCVSLSDLCDGKKDCSNGLDESGMCDASCDTGICEQNCKRTPYGPVCSCNEGFRLAGDKHSCYDIDECLETDPCSQECTNTEGAYRCSCFTGYMLRSDKTTCKAMSRNKFMLLNSFDTIYNLSAYTIEILWSSNGSRIIGMDLNIRKQLLYFTLEDSSLIYEYNFNTKALSYMQQINKPRKLTVDWVTNNVYVVSDQSPPLLDICHMSEKVCVNLLKFKNREIVSSLAVDVMNNRLFYAVLRFSASTAPSSTIYGHALDGSRMTVIVSDAGHVSDFVTDANKQILFYADLSTSSIWSASYDGTSRKQIIAHQNGVTKPIAIMLTEDQLYVLNVGSRTAAHCKSYADHLCKPFEIMSLNADNILVSHDVNQLMISNVCENHKCISVCVAADRGPKCLCHNGAFLRPGAICNDVMVNICICNTFFNNNSIRLKSRFQQKTGSHLVSSQPNYQTSNSRAGSVFTWILVLFVMLGVAAMVYGVYVAYSRKILRKPFVARVHFQNPSRNIATGVLTSESKVINEPVMCTNRRYNQIFLNEVCSDEVLLF